MAAIVFGFAQQGGAARDLSFSSAMPTGVPSVAGWERVAGDAEFTAHRVCTKHAKRNEGHNNCVKGARR